MKVAAGTRAGGMRAHLCKLNNMERILTRPARQIERDREMGRWTKATLEDLDGRCMAAVTATQKREGHLAACPLRAI